MLERSPGLIRTDHRQDRAAALSDDGGISRAELFAFARRHVVAIVGCMLIGFFLGWLNAASQEPTFTAQTQILIDPKTPEILNTEGRAVETSLDTAEVESQMTLLRSEMIANMVIDELDLTNDPEFQGQKPSRFHMLVRSVAELALKSGLVDASRVYDWRERNLGNADAVSPVDQAGAPVVSAADKQIDARRLALAIFQKNLAVSRISVSYVIEITFSSGDAERAAQIANATADAYLREQVLSKIAAIQQGNAWLEGRLNELRRKLNVATQAAQAFRARYDYGIPQSPPSEISEITSGETPVSSVPEEPTLEELEATADTYRKLYGSVLEAFTSSMQHQSYPYSSIRVITPAAEPFEKSRPRTKIVLAFGSLAGLLAGLGIAVARESLDGSVRSARRVRSDLGVDCVAEIPRMAVLSKDRNRLAQGQLSPASNFTLALKRLKTIIRVNAKADGTVAIGITSALRGEGKSVTAAGLGLACVDAGYRTLVVDCDRHQIGHGEALQRPHATEEARNDIEAPGLPDPLKQEGWFDMLSAPSEAGRQARSWKDFQPPYGVVIVDLPPIERAVDVLPTLPPLDFLIILVEWGSTPVDAVEEAVRISEAAGTPLLGIVLTKTPRSSRQRGRSGVSKVVGHQIR
jgi:uncharacterized protein involved in exopolysaccharide biosynthesis/Mrp family chromosome partitioning ATPase